MASGVRTASVRRTTRETDVRARLELDGKGRAGVRTGVGFLDHMLETLARHAAFDLRLEASGDLHVDQHHTVEDTGLVLGQAVSRALGKRRGILRAGWWIMPMDDALAVAAVDLGGRPGCVCSWHLRASRLGDLDAELLEDFFQAFSRSAAANLHLAVVRGRSSHHMVEALFKAFARALRTACARDPQLRRILPTTKGML